MNNAGNIVARVSGLSFEATVEHFVGAIESAGMRVFGKIDHGAAAHAAGLSMPRTIVLLFGNAAKGTPVMLAAPQAALDLPLRILVHEVTPERGCRVAYRPISALLQSEGVPQEMVEALDRAQRALFDYLPANPQRSSQE